METYTYKTVGNLEVKADVYRAEDRVLRPVVLWIHGGALIMGHRDWIDDRVKEMMLGAGYALVSIDYRLAPETKLSAILEDLHQLENCARTTARPLRQLVRSSRAEARTRSSP